MEHTSQYFWEKELPIYKQILCLGLNKYCEKITNLSEAIALGSREIRCADERVTGGIHAAGSLMLMNSDQRRRYAKLARPSSITSHSGCGSARILYKELHPNSTPTNEELDNFAVLQAKSIALELNIPYQGNIGFEKMIGTPRLHVARTIYYVLTENFDWSRVAGLPVGFIVHRRYMDPEYAQNEVNITYSIASSEHGFGGLIDEENPLFLIIVSHNFVPNEIVEELNEVISRSEGKLVLEKLLISK